MHCISYSIALIFPVTLIDN